MATIKHISSKNADYGAAEAYLTFEHDEFRSLLQGKGRGVFVSTARCLSNVLNCFIQLSKNKKEENHLSYIPRWKRGET